MPLRLSARNILKLEEVVMPMLGALWAAVARFMATERRMSRFNCGDCDRWERCGLPPDAVCVHKAMQTAGGDWRLRRRARSLAASLFSSGG
jgi:hypothetical protein